MTDATRVGHTTVIQRVLDRRATRRAAAAAALLAIGRGGRVFEALKGGPDPRVRTYLIHELERVRIDPRLLFDELKIRTDPSIQQAIILALGQYDPMTLGSAEIALSMMTLRRSWNAVEVGPGLDATSRLPYNRNRLVAT